MRHIISLSLFLALLWLLNSGHYTPLIISLGLVSIILVVFIARTMDVVDHESQPIHLTTQIPGYFLWLLKEIVISNIDVVKRIWLGNDSINPTMSTIKMNQRTDMGKVIYANSITLTPGTVSVDLDGDQVTVHALTEQGIESLEQGEMDRRVCEVE